MAETEQPKRRNHVRRRKPTANGELRRRAPEQSDDTRDAGTREAAEQPSSGVKQPDTDASRPQRRARKPRDARDVDARTRKPRDGADARRKRPAATRRRRATIPTAVMILSALVLALILVDTGLAIGKRISKHAAAEAEAQAAAEAKAAKEGKVSFAAMGDNLINAEGVYNVDLLTMADGWAGEVGDGAYDFSPLYAQVKDAVSSYDIAFISQETTLGGLEAGHEYKGFPSFNTPDEMAEAIADAGFDVVNCNTNHTWDLGADAIEHSQEVWAEQDDVITIGSYASEKDREDIRVIEQKGIKIAFLSYSYGQNGYETSDLPNDYYAPSFDKDKMGEEVARAQDLADVVVVYMNWGEDITHDINDQQSDYASYLAGLGVDLVIGSHAHVIQPVEYVARGIRTTDGSGSNAANGMLCVYGLGSPINGYTLPRTSVAGMFTCDFVRNKEGEVSIQNPVWHALVEHNDGETETVYLLDDYTDKLAAQNQLLARVGEDETYTTTDPVGYVRDTTAAVVGDAIEVDA